MNTRTSEATTLSRVTAADARYPWLLIALLWWVAFLISAGRSTLIAVMPQLREEFALSSTQLALINSASFWIYAIGAFLFGRLGDGTLRSRLIVGGLAFWGVATGIASLSTAFALLIAMRGLVALGEATYFPSGTALISDWHKGKLRGRALSVHQTGVFAGGGVGALCAGLIADRFGWRLPFVILGSLGVAVSTLLVRWLRDPPVTGPRPSSDGAREQGPFRAILRRPAALQVCGIFFLASGASAGPIVWAPTFLHDELGLDLGGAALYGSVTINLAGFLFVPVGAFLAEHLAVRTPLAHFYTLALGLALAGLLLLPLPFASSATMVGFVLLASSAGKALFDACIYTAMHDVTPPQARATAVGLMTMVGFCGAGLTPIFVAQASAKFGMASAMASMAGLYGLAVALLLGQRTSLRRAVIETRQAEHERDKSHS